MSVTVAGTLVPGGSFRDISFVPVCSTAVTVSEYSLSAAAAYDPTEFSYYKDQWQLALAGWICAGIILVICLVLLVWLVVLCSCSCCCGWRRLRENDAATSKTAQGVAPFTSYAGSSHPVRKQRGSSVCGVLPILSIIVLILLLAVSAWALYVGIDSTKSVVSNFWGIVDQIQIKVVALDSAVVGFFSGLAGVQQAVAALGSALQGIDVTSLNLPSDLNIASNVGSSLTSAAGTIDGVLSSGVEATDAIQRYGVTELNKFEATYRQPSTKAQDVIIPAILGTMFGVLVVLAVLSTGFIAFCHLRSGGVFLFLLWIWICIICIIGPGLMHSAEKVAGDTCLYAERFVYKVVNETGSLSVERKAMAEAAFQYYFGGTNSTIEDVAMQVYGVDVGSISTLANSSTLNETLAYFGSTVGVQLVSGLAAVGGTVGLNATGQSYLTAAPAKLNQTYEGYNAVIANITRSNFEELYGDIKERLCCDISNTSRTLWISWTVTVAVAGLLGLLLLLRVFLATRHYGRPAPAVQQNFILPDRRAAPFQAP